MAFTGTRMKGRQQDLRNENRKEVVKYSVGSPLVQMSLEFAFFRPPRPLSEPVFAPPST